MKKPAKPAKPVKQPRAEILKAARAANAVACRRRRDTETEGRRRLKRDLGLE